MSERMKVYLDNCCFNRPFDDQSSPVVRLETEAKAKSRWMRFWRMRRNTGR